MDFSLTRWARNAPKDLTACIQPQTHFPRLTLGASRLPEWWQVFPPAESRGCSTQCGKCANPRGWVESPRLVTSHLRGLSALFTRCSYCPAGSLRRTGREPQYRSKDGKMGPGSKGWRAPVLFCLEKGRLEVCVWGGVWVIMVESYCVVSVASCSTFGVRRKGVGESECTTKWENFVNF